MAFMDFMAGMRQLERTGCGLGATLGQLGWKSNRQMILALGKGQAYVDGMPHAGLVNWA